LSGVGDVSPVSESAGDRQTEADGASPETGSQGCQEDSEGCRKGVGSGCQEDAGSEGCQKGSERCQSGSSEANPWRSGQAQAELLRNPFSPASRGAMPVPVLPGEALGEVDIRNDDREGGRRKEARVTVRMTPLQFSRLERAAELNGVAPTTMARMLINRGARSIVDEERAWRATGDPGW